MQHVHRLGSAMFREAKSEFGNFVLKPDDSAERRFQLKTRPSQTACVCLAATPSQVHVRE